MNVNYTRKIFSALTVMLLLSRVSFAFEWDSVQSDIQLGCIASIGAPAVTPVISIRQIAGGLDDVLCRTLLPRLDFL